MTDLDHSINLINLLDAFKVTSPYSTMHIRIKELSRALSVGYKYAGPKDIISVDEWPDIGKWKL